MTAQWIRCPRCSVALLAGPAKCGACGADLPPAETPSPPSNWFVIQDKKKVGPLSFSQVQQLAQQRRLGPDDMILQEGTPKWVPARAVAGLFAEQTVNPSQSVAVAEIPPPPPPKSDTVDDLGRTSAHVAPAAAQRSPSALPIPSIPGYEILGELGRGGMGVVYKARHVALERLVALKMVISGGHAGTAELARFRAEAQAVAKLQHPSIVQVHEVGEHDGLPYFSLEYVPGGTLAGWLRGTPLAAQPAARLTMVLAQAVEAAHAAGVVHRDLKPGNVLLRPKPGVATITTPADFDPKITDFGLAKQLGEDSGQTRTGAIMGTPSYMAPEQASGETKQSGPAADVYALGAILYELLTGRPPFRAATLLETLEQVRSQEPVAPTSLLPGLPRDAETICLKCLAKKPQDRYRSARDLADDLGRFLENRPIVARPASIPERAVKFVKRNRLLAGSAATVFLVMLVATIWSSVAARRARLAEQDARENQTKERLARADAHATAGEMAAKRGHLTEALEEYRKALHAGHRDTARIRLDMAHVHAALYQNAEAADLLEQLLADPEAKELHASVLLLKSYTTMGARLEEGLEGIRQARAMGLPKAEDHFARGMLANTSPEAVQQFQEALDADRTHHPSRVMLGMLLLLLGRVDEVAILAGRSRDLYPNDPNFQLMEALVLVLRGNKAEADRLIRRLEKQIAPQQYRGIQKTVELFAVIRQIDDPDEEQSGRKLEDVWQELQPDLSAVWPALGGKRSSDPLKGSAQLLQIPPVVNRSLMEVAHGLGGVMLGQQDETKLREGLQKHPEGTLYFVYASLLFQQKRYAAARDHFLTARRLPALGKIQRSALRAALLCDMERVLAAKRLDAETLRPSMPIVRDLVALGPLRDEEFDVCARVCVHAGELDLARKIVKDWEDRVGKDNPGATLWRMRAEAQAGNHAGAIEAADRLLKRDPSNADAKKIRAEAIKNLTDLAGKLR